MKPAQRERYADRIEKVIRHLERCPAESQPDLAGLAAVAAMSPWHFHRVFRLMTGETPGECLRRIRLARGLPALERQDRVTRAALDAGYATPQAYARALRAQAGVAPGEARADGSLVQAVLRGARRGARDGQEIAALTIDVVSVEPLRLLAVRNTGAYEELDAAFGRLFGQVTAVLPVERIQGLYAVQFQDPRFTPAADCEALCAVDVGGEPVAADGIEELLLGGGEYLRVHHRGSYDRISGTIDVAYAALLAGDERELAAGPAHLHYWDDPESVAEEALRADVYLPLA